LFETGAIVFHIAEGHAGLPNDANARARAITWMFAALNTEEPPLLDREIAMRESVTSPGTRSACLLSRIAPVNRLASSPVALAMPMAR